MRKVTFCLKMPHNAYIGGIAAIINSYISSASLFNEYGYEIDLFDQDGSRTDKIHFSPFQTALYGRNQYKTLCKRIENGEMDILHIHTSRSSLFLKDVLLIRKIYKKYHTDIFLSIHVGELSTVFRKIPKSWHKKIIDILNTCVRNVVFLSERMQREFIESGLDKDKASLLYNFSDLEIGVNEVDLSGRRSDNVLRLIFVGMINPDKGILDLLEVINDIENADIHLDICGSVTEPTIKERFISLVEKAGNKVTLHGYVVGEEKANLYKKADALILPSYHEGMPLVIVEALTAGCAIISTPVGAIPEILTSENAEWIKAGDKESIKNAVMNLFNDKTRLNSMKALNLQLSTQYGKKYHIKKLCDIYSKYRVS